MCRQLLAAQLELDRRRLHASDALQQVRVAVGSSAAVAQLPDARPELHGTAVAHPTLGGERGRRVTVYTLSQLYLHTTQMEQSHSLPSSSPSYNRNTEGWDGSVRMHEPTIN